MRVACLLFVVAMATSWRPSLAQDAAFCPRTCLCDNLAAWGYASCEAGRGLPGRIATPALTTLDVSRNTFDGGILLKMEVSVSEWPCVERYRRKLGCSVGLFVKLMVATGQVLQ